MANEKIVPSDTFRVYEKLEKEFVDALKYELKYEDNERETLQTAVTHASEGRNFSLTRHQTPAATGLTGRVMTTLCIPVKVMVK